MQIEYSKGAEKELRKLPSKEQRKISKKITYLRINPTFGKQLKGEFTGLRSLRAWPYRIIYRIDNIKIFIVHIAHRQGVYK